MEFMRSNFGLDYRICRITLRKLGPSELEILQKGGKNERRDAYTKRKSTKGTKDYQLDASSSFENVFESSLLLLERRNI